MEERWAKLSGLPVGKAEATPTFSRADLAEVEAEPDLDAELDAEEAAGNAAMARLGFTPEEIARVRGRTVEEITPKPKRTVADVDKELAEFDALRKSDRKAYWSAESEARQIALHEERAKLEARSAKQDEEAPDQDNSADGIADALPQGLRERWEDSPGGLESALDALKTRVSILSELDPAEADDLKAGFDELNEEEQTEIADALSQDAGKWPAASQEQIAEFQETEHGASLVKSWGASAATRLGAARKEADYIVSRLNESSKLRIYRFVESKSATQRAAIIEILARRAARRSLIRSSNRK